MSARKLIATILILVLVCSLFSVMALADEPETAETKSSGRSGWDIADLIVLVVCVSLGGTALFMTSKKKAGRSTRKK